jgi:hypothetical protein
VTVIFASILSPDGSQLLYATYLGGSGHDLAWSLAVDNQGQAFVTGWTDSTNFPVTADAIQPALAGKSDAFLAVLNSAGTGLVYATYLGGEQEDFASSLALDATGNVYLGGHTQSGNFLPKVTPQRLGPGGWQNAFVAKFSDHGRKLEYLTLMGGTDRQAEVSALAVDAGGHAYIFGNTDATNFPVTLFCWQPINRGANDNFLAKLNPSGTAFIYSTYLGGTGDDSTSVFKYLDRNVYLEKAGLAVDNQGNAYLAGTSQWGDVAPQGLAANIYGGDYNSDAFVAKIDPTGSTLLHLAYLGGRSYDGSLGLALDKDGRILVAGYSCPPARPSYFPITAGALQSTNGGGIDAFFTRFREVQGAPPNDAFANRMPLTGARITTFENITTAGKETGEPNHAGNLGGRSLWWSWRAPANGRLMVTTEGSTFNTLLAIYTNHILTQLTKVAACDQVASGENYGHVNFAVVAGIEYQIAVDGHDGEFGNLKLNLTFSAPANDDFANRLITTNFPAILSGSNIDATWEPDDPLSGTTVWWEWVAPITGPVAVSTAGSSFDTEVGVFTNSALSQLGWVAYSDNDTNGVWTSRAYVQAVAGTVYQIGVGGGYSQNMGTIQLSIIPGALPVNNNFTNRVELTGTITNITAHNYGATREPGEPDVRLNYGADQSVWWTWKAPDDGRVTLSTEGSDFSVHLAVFTGNELTNLTPIVRTLPGEEVYDKRVNFAVKAHTFYQIALDGTAWNPMGNIHLALHYYHPFSFTSATIVKSPPGIISLQGQGYSGATYRVEISTNLVDWASIPSLSLTGPTFEWRDTNTLIFGHRFYRFVEKSPGP